LLINEIMYDPPDGQCEWIEVLNGSGRSLNLAGCRVADVDTSRSSGPVEGPFFIPPCGFAILTGDSAFYESHPEAAACTTVLPRFPDLNNEGDAVILVDPAGCCADRVDYNRGWGGGDGVSLERISPETPSSRPESWNSSFAQNRATPGAVNSIPPESAETANARLALTPNPFSPDKDGRDDVALVTCRIPFGSCWARVRIYDIFGRLVKTLISGEWNGFIIQKAWDGTDDRDLPAPVGQYIVIFEATDRESGQTISEKKIWVLTHHF
jgi:hypothetical protein